MDGDTRHGTARHGTARLGTARHGTARHGAARNSTSRHSSTRYGTAPPHQQPRQRRTPLPQLHSHGPRASAASTCRRTGRRRAASHRAVGTAASEGPDSGARNGRCRRSGDDLCPPLSVTCVVVWCRQPSQAHREPALRRDGKGEGGEAQQGKTGRWGRTIKQETWRV